MNLREKVESLLDGAAQEETPEAPWMSSTHRDQTEAIARDGLAPRSAPAQTDEGGEK